ncbi:hypothetical protein AD929_15710 [Gluconobacter potus]|uniref:Uncharacterized protein n=1 Tax=Gluconobacter potus TaxID=2724927 RepID=A0A149QPL6_9PROT|nr:hypothetical protein [Gluconobacter potus]KXU99241.1 hypothetical protein AD929_15710 [Gluconobacter potus]
MSGCVNPNPPVTPPNYGETPLTADELVMCRKYMGYPALGGINSGEQSWRFFQQYGFNEWRFQNMAPAELAQIRQALGRCIALEEDIFGARGNLDTDKAAVWTRNANEARDRVSLYNYFRQQLCGFFGIPPGPGMRGNSSAIVI